MMRGSSKGMIAIAAVVLLLAAGCDDQELGVDRPPPPPPPPPPIPFPVTPDTLMTNFKVAYTSMDIDLYRKALHGYFRFLFNPEDVVRLSLPSASMNAAADLASTYNMFSGNSFQRPDQTVAPGVAQIQFVQFDRTSPWVPQDSASDFPNSESAFFKVEIHIVRVGEASTLVIVGQEQFYVSRRDSVYNGLPMPYYQLVGQRDLSTVKTIAHTTWGGVKYLYRD